MAATRQARPRGKKTTRVDAPQRAATATLTSKGQITIPASVREALDLRTGDRLEFIENNGTFFVRREFDPLKFERALKKLRGKLRPELKGMTTDEIIEAMRGPVDLD